MNRWRKRTKLASKECYFEEIYQIPFYFFGWYANSGGPMARIPTILVIDDDPDLCQALRMVLENNGYHVCIATHAHKGLELAQARIPDLVILDLMMPRMSGFTVLEQLKHTICPATPVLMLTGHAGEHQQALAEHIGVDAYLHKPLSTTTLLSHVALSLAKKARNSGIDSDDTILA